MRHLLLVAAGALGEGRGGEKVMRAALGGACFGMASFRIWHCVTLLSFRISSLSYCFNLSLMSASAAHRGSLCCTLQSHSTRFLFWPHCGHSPLQSALHRLCMGTARKICSFSTSSSSMPSPL